MRRLILRSFLSPGDIVMLTAAVRDLHAACPRQFQTDVRTTAMELWENNPLLTAMQEREGGVEVVDMHYPLIHQSNQRPYHFIHGYAQYLEERLGVRIPITQFRGDTYLSAAERQPLHCLGEQALPERYWVLIAGGKYDFTAKWWNPAEFQRVVDHFQGRIAFVQCGEEGHWHPPLEGVINLVGKTNTREFIRLIHHAEGVVCPVTFAMHLAAAVPNPSRRSGYRPCVVIAGGREPAHWEAYPGHQFLTTAGALPCCQQGGCWKSRCQPVGDGDRKDRFDLCPHPVQVSPDLRIARCMDLITAADVIRAIDRYYEGGVLNPPTEARLSVMPPAVSRMVPPPQVPVPKPHNVLIEFRHGLGDAAQLTIVLRHLQHYHPDWNVDVAAQLGKHSAYHGLCRNVYVLDRDKIDRSHYQQVHRLDWHECRTPSSNAPSTKPIRCLLEEFRLTPIPELCSYQIRIGDTARDRAKTYLAEICPDGPLADGRYPVVLMHYQGNTSAERKNLPHELVSDICEVLQRLDYVPVILDWDGRSPLIDQVRIFNPGSKHYLWDGTGTGDAETLAALIAQSSLLIGVDSGPLHVAGATDTPVLGVWTQYHPVHFFDLCANAIHLVPGDHQSLVTGPQALEFFTKHYRHHVYKQLFVELPAMVESQLTGTDVEQLANKRFLKQLTATGYSERYYHEHKLAGLDYLNYGDWQEQYGRWFVESLGLRGKRLLDVGSACGALVKGLGQAGAIVQGVEINEYMVQLARDKWPDMAPLLHVCDAVNLHLFPDESWDALHSAQVAEHWKPELVPHILRKLQRVTKPQGLLFCALDTEELFARQNRDLADEDPTHVCIRPLSWWHDQLRDAGWEVVTEQYEQPLRNHRESFLKRYDWDWFVARKN